MLALHDKVTQLRKALLGGLRNFVNARLVGCDVSIRRCDGCVGGCLVGRNFSIGRLLIGLVGLAYSWLAVERWGSSRPESL